MSKANFFEKPIAVIFDFDGVVVDSMALHLECWKIAHLQQFGIPLDSIVGLAGRSTTSIASILAAKAGRPNEGWFLAEKKKQILSAKNTQIPLIPGVLRFMEILRAKNIPFGIGSNAPRNFIQQCLAFHKIEIPCALGIEDSQRPKPAPDIFLAAAQKLGIGHLSHRFIIVFEDSTHGISAAVDAGMQAIGITTQHDEETLAEAGAKASFPDFELIGKQALNW